MKILIALIRAKCSNQAGQGYDLGRSVCTLCLSKRPLNRLLHFARIRAILIYVEGASDLVALQSLLNSVIIEAQGRAIGVRFLAKRSKARLLAEVPGEAADHLGANPLDWVVALPDLYPMAEYDNTKYPHRSPEELRNVLTRHFNERARRQRLPQQVRRQFLVHCLKHDLEVLLLAAEEQLRTRLGTKDRLRGHWTNPVEDQNDRRPPKQVVSELFRRYSPARGYVDTVDAQWILERASLADIEAKCPQCFGPFVSELRSIIRRSRGS